MTKGEETTHTKALRWKSVAGFEEQTGQAHSLLLMPFLPVDSRASESSQ